jgi:hypothetical protein
VTTLARSASLAALAAALAIPASARPPADDLPTPPKSGTIVTAGQNKMQLAAARKLSQNNLKQIALAFLNYESANGSYPGAGIYDKSGKVGLSWRVTILPYVEQAPLYKEFKLDEPWDSDHNKALIAKMPKLYAPPKGAEVASGLTYYRVFTGPDTVFPPAPPNGKAGLPAPGIKIVAITDGTSNTVSVAEAADPVIWTKPDELVYDPKKPTPKLGGVFEGGFHVAMCDGSVRYLPAKIDDKVLRAIITANGGEVVDIP